MKCLCHSQKDYNACCKTIHEGEAAESPERLMRARYCAYAKGFVDFIIESSAQALRKKIEKSEGIESWKSGILAFSQTTEFYGLEIIEAKKDQVIFKAFLRSKAKDQKKIDMSFQEKSFFIKEPMWRYLSGEVSKIN